jgi:4-amino-4-deoxy-L-arabinose transferase-like glycosyltransferase
VLSPPRRPPLSVPTLATLLAAKLALHIGALVATPYGFHRDEFLYFAMGERLRLWRMDFPPAIALLARGVRALLGDSLPAIHLVPVLAGSAVLVLAVLIARELGGTRFAQALAGLCVLASPLFLRTAYLFQPVVLDQLCWTAGLYALARLARTGDPRWWLALGAAAGFGLLAKFSIAFFGAAVLVALLATTERRTLATRWPWLAVLIALVIGSPSLVGQLRLGFPVVGYSRELQAQQLVHVSGFSFFAGQLRLGPAVAVATVGLAWLLFARDARPFRVLGWSCLAAFAILALLHGKPYYVGPVYPTLFAAGAVWLERVTTSAARGPRLAARWSTAGLVAAYGLALLPLGLPILRPPLMARYASAMGLTSALTTNTGEVDALPQDYADMLGWEEMVAGLARVYDSLSPDERRRAVIVAGNYGEAGAVDFYGPRLGLPRAVSPAGTYWFFGPGDRTGEIVVALGVPPEDLGKFFGEVTPVGHVGTRWAVSEERNVPIAIGRRPVSTLQAIWPTLKE